MNSDNQQQAVRPETTKTTSELSDPMETLLEAAARLRVLERLLQHALAPEAATERRSLVRRYNRQRRELLKCLAAVPTGPNRLPHERPAAIAGPLRQDCSDQVINAAVGSVQQLLDQLFIS